MRTQDSTQLGYVFRNLYCSPTYMGIQYSYQAVTECDPSVIRCFDHGTKYDNQHIFVLVKFCSATSPHSKYVVAMPQGCRTSMKSTLYFLQPWGVMKKCGVVIDVVGSRFKSTTH